MSESNYLITTRMTKLPKNKRIWFLTPACLSSVNQKIEDAGVLGIIADPFSHAYQINQAYLEIWNSTNELISLLSNKLNYIHNESYDEKYWRMHIGFWALNFATMIYDRRARLF